MSTRRIDDMISRCIAIGDVECADKIGAVEEKMKRSCGADEVCAARHEEIFLEGLDPYTKNGEYSEIRLFARRITQIIGRKHRLAPSSQAFLLGRGNAWWMAQPQTMPPQRPATPELIAYLYDPDPRARHEALVTLESMGSDAATALHDIVTVSLRDRDRGVREAAICLLQRLHVEGMPVLPAVLENVRDDDPGVRLEALRALGWFHIEPADVSAEVSGALRSHDFRVQREAARALATMDPEVLVEALSDQDPDVRLEAAKALKGTRFARTRGLPALVRELKNAVSHCASALARVLMEAIGDYGPDAAPAVPTLMLCWGKSTTSIVAALQKIGPAAATAKRRLLEEAAKEGRSFTRPDALWALVSLCPDDHECLETAVDMCVRRHDNSLRLRWTGRNTHVDRKLAELDPNIVFPMVVTALRKYRKIQPGFLRDLIRSDNPETAAFVAAAATDADPYVRMHMVWLLGAYKFRSAFPALKEALGDADARVQLEAISSLSVFGGLADEATPALIDLFVNSTDVEVRRRAARALARVDRTGRALPAFMDALRDTNPQVRRDGVYGLGGLQLADDVKAALMAALRDEDVGVREEAIDVLGNFGPAAKDADYLLTLMESHKVYGWRARSALRKIRRGQALL